MIEPHTNSIMISEHSNSIEIEAVDIYTYNYFLQAAQIMQEHEEV